MVKIKLATLPKGELRFWIEPSTRDKAMMVITGRPTAVMRKPNAANQTCSPACCATIGGKIILPAPIKSAKVIKPKAIISRVRRLVIEGEID